MDQSTRQRIQQNVSRTRKGTQSTRYGKKGLTTASAKMNHHNFNKLMQKRGISKSNSNQVWNSFSHKSAVMGRHAKKGEQFHMTSGQKNASGVFVSQKSLGKNPSQRINKGALPPSNTAQRQQNVQLGKNQNVVYGKIAPQKQFQKADPKNLPRKGGGYQTITNGGFKTGAVKNVSADKANYVSKAKSMGASKGANQISASKVNYASKVKSMGTQKATKTVTKSTAPSAAKSHSKSKGQSR